MNNIAPRHIAAFPPRHTTLRRGRLDGVFADWIRIAEGSSYLRHYAGIVNFRTRHSEQTGAIRSRIDFVTEGPWISEN